MTAVSDVAKLVHSRNAPILFLDTCSILDVFRGVGREDFRPPDAAALSDFLEWASLPVPKLTILIAEQVTLELSDHMDTQHVEADRAVAKFDTAAERAVGILAAFGVDAKLGSWKLGTSEYARVARSVVERCRSVSTVVDSTEEIKSRAMHRIIKNLPPCNRGEQAKDCLIIETYFATLNAARGLGFALPACFLTSNTADFAAADGQTPRGQLATEFADLDLDLVTSFAQARYGPLKS